MFRFCPWLAVALASFLTACFAGTALAQAPTRACCLPDNSCIVTTAYECTQAGGIWRAQDADCSGPPCTTIRFCSIGMSQTAARRLVREGVVHTLQISDAEDFYSFDPNHPMWQLMAPVSENGYGAIIALQIPIDLRNHVGETIEESAQAAAAALVELLHGENGYKAMWDEYHDNLPFHWALRLDGLGAGWDWQIGPGRLPSFTNHEDDVADDRLPRQKYFDWGGHVQSANGTTVQIAWNDDLDFYEQFPSDHFTEPTSVAAATITVGQETRTITGFTPSTQTITVDAAFTGSITSLAFRINRGDPGANGSLFPCYFFKEGAEDMGEWVQAFCNAMRDAMESQSWDPEIGHPVAVTVSDEDLNLSGVDALNYMHYYNDDRAERVVYDEGYRIDANHTLREWHAAFAKDRMGTSLSFVTDGSFSPLDIDRRSYLIATISTAYNYYRDMSTWQHFRALWPRAHLSQYQLGNNYGVTIEVGEEHISVPFGPGEEVYHGSRDWQGSITWDAYYCLTSPTPSAWYGPDGGIVPMGYTSANAFEGTVAAWSSNSPRVLTVNSAGINSTINQEIEEAFLGVLYDEDFELFVQLPTNGVHAPHIFKVALESGWNETTLTFTLDPLGPPLSSVSTDDHFIVYYPSTPYRQFIESNGDTKWSLLQTYCDRYGEPITEEGFLATSKHWAAERARAHTRAHPEKPYTVYYGPGTQDNTLYDGDQEHVSFLNTFPHNPNSPLICKDGWLDGTDWYEVALQAMNFGVNDFVWFVPELVDSPLAVQTICNAITGMVSDYWNPAGKNLPQHYTDIACIADWDQNGLLSHEDVKGFYSAYLNENPIADLNNDGAFTQADVAIFEAADDCGLERDCNGNDIADSVEIAQGDLDPEDEYPDLDTDDDGRIDGCQNCAADWDVSNEVEVTDIFAFLTDWFNNVPAAQNFGGTPGVAAIFAFLTVWFAHGVGECGT